MTENRFFTGPVLNWKVARPGARTFSPRAIGVPVDMIAATRMGLFVDGLCASNMSVTDIENSPMTAQF